MYTIASFLQKQFLYRVSQINESCGLLHGRRQYRPTVAVVMRSREDRWLLAQSAKRNVWYTPQGGIDPGECVLEAIFREMYEECAISRSSLIMRAFMGVGSQDIANMYRKGFSRGKFYFFFLVDYIGNENALVLQRSELSSVNWLDTGGFVRALGQVDRRKYESVIRFFVCSNDLLM